MNIAHVPDFVWNKMLRFIGIALDPIAAYAAVDNAKDEADNEHHLCKHHDCHVNRRDHSLELMRIGRMLSSVGSGVIEVVWQTVEAGGEWVKPKMKIRKNLGSFFAIFFFTISTPNTSPLTLQ